MDKNSIKFIGIFLRPDTIISGPTVFYQILELLINKKIKLFFLNHEKSRLQSLLSQYRNFKDEIFFVSESKLLEKSDLLLSLGGDGTLLNVIRSAKDKGIPVLGVNLGHLGFITEFTSDSFFNFFSGSKSNKIKLNEVSLFDVEIFRKDKLVKKNFFVNDIVFTKNNVSKMLSLSVDLNGENVFDLTSDGLIICSSLGSTAYSLSAGGPIVHQKVNTLILTPICAHKLTHRPLVVPGRSKILIRPFAHREGLVLILDGQIEYKIHLSDTIRISQSIKSSINLVCNPKRVYFNTLKEKFFHGK